MKKENQTKILELKNTMIKLKKSIENFNSTLGHIKEIIKKNPQKQAT